MHLPRAFMRIRETFPLSFSPCMTNPMRPSSIAARKNALVTLAWRLMVESHASLRDLYEVSRSELDLLVTLATQAAAAAGLYRAGA